MFKMLFKIICILLTLFLLATGICFAYHSVVKLTEKKKIENAPGELVSVYGHNMHVYSEGTGDTVYVFLSGNGTACPVLDFKPFYKELSNNSQIFVIERFGYGYSEDYDSSRDINTVLDETRTAFHNAKAYKKLDENTKVILVAHGEAGIEAIYWAQKYPSEVKAIIGLDAFVPEMITNGKVSGTKKITYQMRNLFANVGFTRVFGIEDDDTLEAKNLSDSDEEIYRAFIYNKGNNKIMQNEIDRLSQNAEIVARGEKPSIPMYCYLGSSNYMTNFNDEYAKYVSSFFGRYEGLSASHHLYLNETEYLVKRVNEFVDEIK